MTNDYKNLNELSGTIQYDKETGVYIMKLPVIKLTCVAEKHEDIRDTVLECTRLCFESETNNSINSDDFKFVLHNSKAFTISF